MENRSNRRKRELIPNELLRQAREEKDWTQGQLAAALKVNEHTVYTWESGRRTCSHSYEALLCDVLGKTREELGMVSSQKLDNDEIR